MRRSQRFVPFLTAASLALATVAPMAQQVAAPGATPAALDFEFFRTRVQPVFLAKREGHARCIACHTTASGMRMVQSSLRPMVVAPGWSANSRRDPSSRNMMSLTFCAMAIRGTQPSDSTNETHP